MPEGTDTRTANVLRQAQAFYDREFSGEKYMAPLTNSWPNLKRFVTEHNLVESGKCIEFGCGRAENQDMVRDYTGTDISSTVAKHFRPDKTFVQCSATDLPFPDNSFDGGWSIWVLEHVPEPEKMLSEIRRVIKPGGVVFLHPAWQVREWAANGYPVRPYSDFGLRGKLIKASVPLRNWIVWRSLFVFSNRFLRLLERTLSKAPTKFRFKRLTPNFEKFWMPDSDAMNKMDPYEAIVWFRSRGDEIIYPASPLKQFLIRTNEICIRVRK